MADEEYYPYQLAAEYWPDLSREDFDQFSGELSLTQLEWGDIVDNGVGSRAEKVRRFYEESFGIVFQLLPALGPNGSWPMDDHKANVAYQNIQRFAPAGAPILDYGGGAGQHSIFLARRGLQVAYADLGNTAEFAAWRFEREGLLPGPVKNPWGPGSIISITPEKALTPTGAHGRQPWGAILALDLLEHVPDPVGLLRAFDGCLAPDGLLVLTRHSFKPYPAHLPETMYLQESLDDVLGEIGYRPVIPPDGHFGIGGWRHVAQDAAQGGR